ncbi:MAG: XdhC family protein [Acidimicrobiia bacterium]
MRATGEAHILDALTEAVSGGEPVVLATIVGTEGSVPRHAGTKMVVGANGSSVGTIGGGTVEATIQADALDVLSKRRPVTKEYVLKDPDEGDVGVCGGTMTVYLEPYMAPHTVYIIGAGHVGRAVGDLAHWLGYRTVVVDDRTELVTEEAMPNADERFAGAVEDALEAVPVTASTSIVVVTRSHELDARITPRLLDTPARYIGVMGSRRRWEATRGQLDDEGISASAMDRIHNPIGMDIAAETVEEIAVSIMSEVIAAVNEGS